MANRYTAALIAAAIAISPFTAARVIAANPAVIDAPAEESALRARVHALLDRYASKDVDGVIAMLDPQKFTILGSDISEVADTAEELRALMEADFRLWGTATFSEVREFDWRSDGTLATANFLMSFSASGGEAVPVRLTTTWRKVAGEWRLTQCASSVPTRRG